MRFLTTVQGLFCLVFNKELHLKGVKHSLLVVNNTEVSQTDHQPNPENSAGDAQTHHPAHYARLCNLILLLTMLLSTFRFSTTLTEISGQNPPSGIPVPLSDPVPLYG